MSYAFIQSSDWLAMAAAAYFVCAVPFGLVITKYILGYDVREKGSRNIGMTNVMRTGGRWPGIATFALDFSKGLLFVLAVGQFLPDLGAEAQAAIAIVCVVAHTKSVYLKFKGGKGVATNFGVWLGLDWVIALLAMLIWLGAYKKFKISSLGGLISSFSIVVMSYLVHRAAPLTWSALILGIYIFWLHRENIKRLLKGEELPMSGEKK